jgi:succinate-semialdehyde dehydrogenase/glutarate-semialdehyde dehydrogenase
MEIQTLPSSSLALLIDGEWLGADGRQTHTVINPATNRPIGSLPLAGSDDIQRAAEAAGRAFPGWRATPPERRAEILHRAAALLRERKDAIAHLVTLEQGKPLVESADEVDFSVGVIDFSAGEAERLYGTVVPTGPMNERTLVLPEPIGPVAAFTPWNYPVIVPARKIAAALAAGCTIVIKCAEETPASGVEVVRAFVDAGVPAGVLGLLFGAPAEISTTLIRSPLIRKISFTGSTAIGRQIGALAGQEVKPCMLELGGHAPVLVFDDADLDAVVRGAVGGKFHNAGQSCGSPTRFYVQSGIHDAFVEGFSELTRKLSVGNGLDPGVDMGPLANPRRQAAIADLTSDAVSRGAELVVGGTAIDGEGFYWAPTLLANVPEQARIMNEEPFGPVASTASFSTVDEVIARANRVPYGLGAYVFTSSLETATVVPRALEVGMVGVNKFTLGGASTYFGGVKASGFGSEGGPEAVRGYLSPKLILQG